MASPPATSSRSPAPRGAAGRRARTTSVRATANKFVMLPNQKVNPYSDSSGRREHQGLIKRSSTGRKRPERASRPGALRPALAEVSASPGARSQVPLGSASCRRPCAERTLLSHAGERTGQEMAGMARAPFQVMVLPWRRSDAGGYEVRRLPPAQTLVAGRASRVRRGCESRRKPPGARRAKRAGIAPDSTDIRWTPHVDPGERVRQSDHWASTGSSCPTCLRRRCHRSVIARRASIWA